MSHVAAPTDSCTNEPRVVRKMDRMYRWTRHVYDATRKYYLLGRDQMLDEIAARSASAVLEVGCGTARNLHYLSKRAPQHTLYGMDASHEMLDTARRSLQRGHLSGRITLAHGLAGDVTPKMMGREKPFDVVFFSYVLSMIPEHQPAVEAALASLRSGGRMYVVDFWDQGDLPCPCARLLQGWLAMFDVRFRPGVIDTLCQMDGAGTAETRIHSVARRYAYLAEVTKTASAKR